MALELPEPLFGADRPIRSAKDDKLGLSSFVSRLLRPLLHPGPESLVVGLYGPWGQGKSSLLYLVEEALTHASQDEQRGMRAIPIRFTPWLYRDVDSLLDAFFHTLRKGVGERLPWSLPKRLAWAHAVDGIGKSLSSSKGLLDTVLPPASSPVHAAGRAMGTGAIGAVAAVASHPAAGAAIGFIGGTISAIGQSVMGMSSSGEQRFLKYRAQAEKVLRSLADQEPPARVVVLIDDLDRADAPEILAMLRLVKLVADLSNVSYLIAMDDQRVRDVLATQAGSQYGGAFLDKIVQVSIHVPTISEENLSNALLQEAKSIAHSTGLSLNSLDDSESVGLYIEERNIAWRLLAPRVRTLRDVTRLLNVFRFMLQQTERAPELHARDALLISSLQAFFPMLYSAVRDERAFLLNEDPYGTYLSFGSDKSEMLAKRGAYLSALAQLAVTGEKNDPVAQRQEDADRHAAERILRHLFPFSTFEGTSNEALRLARTESRVQTPEYFDAYFSLHEPLDDVRQASVIGTIAALAHRDSEAVAYLTELLDGMTAAQRSRLVSRLRDRLPSEPTDVLLKIASSLLGLRSIIHEGTAYLLGLDLVSLLQRPYAIEDETLVDHQDESATLASELLTGLPWEYVDSLIDRVVLSGHSPFSRSENPHHARLVTISLDQVRRRIAEIREEIIQTGEVPAKEMWSWRRLLLLAGEGPLGSAPAEIEVLLRQLLRAHPRAVALILAMVKGTPVQMSARWESDQDTKNLSNFLAVEHLAEVARSLSDEDTSHSAYPVLVRGFLESTRADAPNATTEIRAR